MRDKIKSLSKDTLIYGTSTIIQRFLTFLLIPLYTNKFAPGEYGIVANIFAYIAILNVFFSIGFESGYFKFASTLESGSKKENFSLPFFTVFVNSLILSSILYFFSSSFTSLFQIEAANVGLLKYTAVILFFDAIVLIPFAYLRLHHEAKKFGTIKVINIVVNISLNIILIFYFNWGIEAVFVSNLVASALTFVMLLPVVLKNISFTFHKKLYSELWKFSLPLIPAGISANLVQVIDRPILQFLTDKTTVGIYQANYRLGIFMMLFVSVFEFAWRPFFLQTAKEQNAKFIFSKIMTLFIFVTSFLFLILSFFIEDIAKFPLPVRGYLIGEKYWPGLNIVPVVLLGYFFYGIYVNLLAGIYIEKKTKHLPLVTGIGAAVNVGVNFLLIPYMGIMGAALATLASYIAMMIGLYITVNKYYQVHYELTKIYLIFFSMFAAFFLYMFTEGTILHNWYFKFFFIVIYFVLIFAFKVVTVNDIRNLKNIRGKR